MDCVDLLERQADAWGLNLGVAQRECLLRYSRLLADYDRANVIGTRNMREIIAHHVLDSLSLLLFGPISGVERLADVGSGGGLPGIPLKIAKPEVDVTLVESTSKKSRFLQHASETLELEGLKVSNTRVEDLGRASTHREAYDVVTARALARLSVVAEYCVPLLRVGGWTISMKGRLEQGELVEGERAAEALGARISERQEVPWIPEIETKERQLVVLEKVRETPARYPRRPGAAAKKPLGSR
ncbi:MAG: 16S rRNA (guanine(527)-N(7))-methyltransferase RsmG [Rubrobacter sp.]